MKTTKTTTEQKTASKRRVLSGVVVSDKMTDTAVVKVVRFVKHPKYGKFQKLAKKFKADDKGNTVKIGDQVSIEECRPISKDKHFKIVK
ncbi:MAG: 30S ribosomal protein S17 [Candidatus Paceibacterota bacterium]|jgi:small subunit ribosomal protein S17